jgi:hypothetical protein
LPEDEGQEEKLGRAIISALQGSRLNVPHPSDWKLILRPLLAVSGVKAWTAFSKSAMCLEVEEEGGRVALIPTRYLGVDGGFEQRPKDAVFTTCDDPRELGSLAAEMLRAPH